jgi:methyltransferase (TIGR00027 family)
VAAVRAAESARPDRLFSDRFAAVFVRAGEAAGRLAAGTGGRQRREGLIIWVVTRTRFLDDLVLGACSGGIRQVVILGAGLDARAFRLAWPEGVRLYELDLPGILDFKEGVVRAQGWKPMCERVLVPVDLAGDWPAPLGAAGFDAEAPVVFLAEGLLAYLSAEASDLLVSRAARLSTPGSRLGLTLASASRLKAWREAHPESSAGPGDYVALWRSAGAEGAVEWLASHGWRAAVFSVEERSVAYGRPEVHADHGARLVDAERI